MTKNTIGKNLQALRKGKKWSQEFVAEKVEVSRQSLGKWEKGESLPDLINCLALAQLFAVSLDELVTYDEEKEGFPLGPPGKYIFGLVTVGERGQIVLPKKAREKLKILPGEQLMVLGDTNLLSKGLALVDANDFLRQTEHQLDHYFKEKKL